MFTTYHVLSLIVTHANGPLYFQGRKLEDLTTEIQDKGIFLSVIAPRRLSALFKLFEKAGGDLVGAKEKNYAKDPRHLVLLNGYTLQERPITPKPLPPASVSPSIPSSLHDQVNPGNVVPGPGPIQGQAPVPYSTQAPGIKINHGKSDRKAYKFDLLLQPIKAAAYTELNNRKACSFVVCNLSSVFLTNF